MKKILTVILAGALALGLIACSGGNEVKNLNAYLAGKTFLVEDTEENETGTACRVMEELITFNEDGTVDKSQYIATALSKNTTITEETFATNFGHYTAVMDHGQLVINLYHDKNAKGQRSWHMRVETHEDGSYTIRAYDRDGELIEVPASTELPTKDYSYLMTEISGESKDSSGKTSGSFTNKYGSSSTKCVVSGCDNYIASSGDTNCCTTHSNNCLECNCYIDGDAMYCMSCLEKAFE